ncbi:MAG: hypothetical protein RBR20_02275 [Desulfobacterales bacterium]|nr:hypothetical protein [Desulfobacterales bacterium]
MKRCPVCRANLKDGESCRRCGADLTRLIQIETAARSHYQAAVEAFSRDDFGAMYTHAREAAAKRDSPATRRLLACATLLSGDPSRAFSLWRRLNS